LKGFHFSHDAEAVFGDVDAMGHVNNTIHLKWIETARIAYWIHVTGQKTGSLARGPGVMAGVLIDLILARTEIDYRSPVSYGEKLDVFVRATLIKRSSLILEYVIAARGDSRVVAEAKTVVVCYDYVLNRTKPVSQELKAAILALDPETRVEI
jgi:acyl-CoA thioester hydrolase